MMLPLLKPYLLEIAKYGGILFGMVIFWFKARQSGKDIVERKKAMETLKAVQTRGKIENNLNNLSDDKLNKLYNKTIKRN
jgi:hypothetical protein